jgi:tetratricopeptide (TPR) repeat protein
MDARLVEAQALLRQGQVQLAEVLCRQALDAQPELAAGWAMLGGIAAHKGEMEQAVAHLERSIALDASQAAIHYRLGLLRGRMGQWPEASRAFEAALALSPHSAEAAMNLGVSLYEQYRFGEALVAHDRALALAPGHPDVLFNRANVLMELDRFDEAVAAFDAVQRMQPRDVGVRMNRANALRDQHRFGEAMAAYDEALAMKPDDAGLHWNRALCLLTQGDDERGWAEYEWRFRAGKLGNAPREFAFPAWDGKADLQGKTVLLHAEQGLGDTLQMARYVPVLAGRGARVVLQVPKALVDVLAGVRGVAKVVANGEPVEADFHVPMMSAPHLCGTRRDTIPPGSGWLLPRKDLVAQWREVIRGSPASDRDAVSNVGLVWSGNPGYAGDHRRSLTLREFRAALPPGPRYWCLQKDVTPADEPLLQDPVAPIARFEQNDFIHTAAQIASLDLVISADTSVMHLAGSLGAPLWLFLPFTADFRWGTDMETTPWYPQARLFRQERPGAWGLVLERMRSALAGL